MGFDLSSTYERPEGSQLGVSRIVLLGGDGTDEMTVLDPSREVLAYR